MHVEYEKMLLSIIQRDKIYDYQTRFSFFYNCFRLILAYHSYKLVRLEEYFILTVAKICNHTMSMYPQRETTILTEFTFVA